MGKSAGKPHQYFTKKMTWVENTKVIDNIVLADGPLSLDSNQHTNEEDMSIFQSTNSVYDMDRLNRLGYLLAGVVMQKNNKLLRQNYSRSMEYEKHEHG